MSVRRSVRRFRSFLLLLVILTFILVNLKFGSKGSGRIEEFGEEENNLKVDRISESKYANIDFTDIPSPPIETLSCLEWLMLEKEELEKDSSLFRDFSEKPIAIVGLESRKFADCDVPCEHSIGRPSRYDARAGEREEGESSDTITILRNMESSQNYPSLNVDFAHSHGSDIVMTTSLNSDVPVGYFSWAEYDIMKPLTFKKPENVAAAFISNCGAANFRLEAMKELIRKGITVDSFGRCMNNKDGRGSSKVDILSSYKFYCAFENSNEEDYVTEKYLHALVSGSVPIYIGAPNIADYEPQENSVISISKVQDLPGAVEKIKYLLANETAYQEMLAWKQTGPSPKFLALLDLAVVHSSCRVCIHIATNIRRKELASGVRRTNFRCRNQNQLENSFMYNIMFRERGTFNFESVFFEFSDSKNLSKSPLERLKALIMAQLKKDNYQPIWTSERPDYLDSLKDGKYNLYRIYPVGTTQRNALYGESHFSSDHSLIQYLASTHIPQLEIILI